jgi:hypothetical protein
VGQILKNSVIDIIRSAILLDPDAIPKVLERRCQVVFVANPEDLPLKAELITGQGMIEPNASQTPIVANVSSNNADPVTLYTVPAGKIAYITGYTLLNQGPAQNLTITIAGTSLGVHSLTGGGTAGCLFGQTFGGAVMKMTAGQTIVISGGGNNKSATIWGWEVSA